LGDADDILGDRVREPDLGCRRAVAADLKFTSGQILGDWTRRAPIMPPAAARKALPIPLSGPE